MLRYMYITKTIYVDLASKRLFEGKKTQILMPKKLKKFLHSIALIVLV